MTREKITKPNFFIVGAPKCGTTALDGYLKTHPNIYMSQKEIHFFNDDMANSSRPTGEEYLKLFSSTKESHIAVGEASVWYLYSSVAIKNIYNFNKNAKIIVMLRNPVELVPSLHAQLLFNLQEDEMSLEGAWNLQPLRRKGMRIPSTCLEPAVLQYADIARYSVQVERLLKYFPAEQVKIILFDDFVSSTKNVYEDVLSFLDVPLDERTVFPVVNPNKTHRSRLVSRMFLGLTSFWGSLGSLRKFLGLPRLALHEKLCKLNQKKISREPITSELHDKLLDTFLGDIKRLSNISGRDLSSWMR